MYSIEPQKELKCERTNPFGLWVSPSNLNNPNHLNIYIISFFYFQKSISYLKRDLLLRADNEKEV